jgi:hypothetical protein
LLELFVLADQFLVEVLQLSFLRLQVGFGLENPFGDAQVGLQLGDVQRLVQEGVRARLQRLQFVLFLPARREHHQVGVVLRWDAGVWRGRVRRRSCVASPSR